MRDVIIATPSYDGRNVCAYTAALVASTKACLEAGINLVPVFMCYDARVHNARNDLLALAVRSESVSDIIWIDADIDWHPAWILRLLEHKADVVGGTYRKKTDAFEGYEFGGSIDKLRTDAAGLMQADHLATGFLRTSRKAFLALWESSPAYLSERGEQRRAFDHAIEDGVERGEDVGMCRKFRALGFTINLDPAMCCNHTGVKTWSGNFQAFADRLLADVAKDAPARRKAARPGKPAKAARGNKRARRH